MKILIPVLLYFVMSPISHADNHNNGVSSLSPDLQKLFSKEMIQLKQGMHEIMDAYVSGEWDVIAPIAKKMEGSYVLRQSLSQSQMHELHSKLPSAFLELDDKFHYYSGMLSHASEMKKTELIGYYYGKMSETCVSCHSSYATHKFPSFKPKTVNENHHH
jgi:hypothetical protein